MGFAVLKKLARKCIPCKGIRRYDFLTYFCLVVVVLFACFEMLSLYSHNYTYTRRTDAGNLEAETRLFLQPANEQMLEKFAWRKIKWKQVTDNNKPLARKKRFPDIIGIGAEKCGTDAVISFLNHHPLIKLPPNGSETYYFNYKKKEGEAYYMNLMPKVTKNEIVMEKTPGYFHAVEGNVAMDIKMFISHPRLILILCDPAKRAYSDFVHEIVTAKLLGSKFPTNSTFHEFVLTYLPEVERSLKYWKTKSRDPTHIHRKLQEMVSRRDRAYHVITVGMYYYYITWWSHLFPLKDMLILNGEDMMKDPGAAVERMQEFIGIPRLILKEDFIRSPSTGFHCYLPHWKRRENTTVEDLDCLADTKGRTRYKSLDSIESDLKRLREFYKPYNELLYKMLKRDMHWD